MTDQRHPPPRCNRSVLLPLLLVVAAASGAFDLSVMPRPLLKHIGIGRQQKIGVSVSAENGVLGLTVALMRL